MTDSEYIAFQDADDLSYPKRFEAQLSFLERSNLDGCGTWSIQVDGNDDPIGFDTLPELVTVNMLKAQMFNLLHPTTLFHRQVFSTLGGFDASTKLGADTEFLFRIVHQFKIGNVQQFLYRHIIHPSSLTQSPETGFSSSIRKKYTEKLIESITAIWDGKKSFPSPGYLLNGDHSALKEKTVFEIIQIGERNKTWRRSG